MVLQEHVQPENGSPAGTKAAEARPHRSLLWSLMVPTCFLVAVLVVAIGFYTPRAVIETAMEDAVKTGEHTAKQLQNLRTFYSDNVASKANREGSIKAAPIYKGDPNTIPVPTTFVLDFAKAFESDDVQVRLVSPFPWPTRSGRVLDDFQKEAWEYLKANPAGRLARRGQINGREVLRVAIADTMNASCVACHNSSSASPKTGWKVGDVRGVIEVVQSVDTALAGSKALSWELVAGIILAGVVLLALLLANGMRLVRPLRDLSAAIHGIAGGELSGAVPHTQRHDELGVVARALKVLRAQIDERSSLQAGVSREVEARRLQLERFRALADKFDSEVQSLLQNVTAVAGEMKQTTGEMARLAGSTEHVAGSSTARVASFRNASTQVLQMSNDFAAVFEAVSRSVAESTSTAEVAAARAAETNQVVRNLSNNAQRIGDVVSLIRDIANQTNLLALNATIEAARAGEAGRGFAVVASEVKLLADRIAKATTEVSGQITEIQTETANAVTAISSISETILAASASSGNLVDQVEGQVQSSRSVMQHMRETIEGAEHISMMLGTILDNASVTRERALVVAEAANSVSDTLDQLNGQATQFSKAMKVA
jgi:methyl-accepting chemotaxis protein